MNIIKKLDGLGITTLGVAFTLSLYMDTEKNGVLKLNNKVMTKKDIDEVLNMNDETAKKYIDELKEIGFLDYRRIYDKERKLTVNIYSVKEEICDLRFKREEIKEKIKPITMEARGLFIKILKNLEKEKSRINIYKKFDSTYKYLEQISFKNKRSIERYISEYQDVELMSKDRRGSDFNFMINPLIFKEENELSDIEKETLNFIKNSKTRKWEFIEKRKERKNKKNEMMKPQKIVLNKRVQNEYYERKEIEKILPSFQTTIIDSWKKILYQFDNSCALTGKKIKISQQAKGMEHFIPLAIGHGGTNEQNVYPMDRFLNYSKNNKNPFIWIRELEFSPLVKEGDYPAIYENFQMLVEYLAIKNELSVKEFEEYVNWCFDNPRTLDDIKKSEYISSLELWLSKKDEVLN